MNPNDSVSSSVNVSHLDLGAYYNHAALMESSSQTQSDALSTSPATVVDSASGMHMPSSFNLTPPLTPTGVGSSPGTDGDVDQTHIFSSGVRYLSASPHLVPDVSVRSITPSTTPLCQYSAVQETLTLGAEVCWRMPDVQSGAASSELTSSQRSPVTRFPGYTSITPSTRVPSSVFSGMQTPLQDVSLSVVGNFRQSQVQGRLLKSRCSPLVSRADRGRRSAVALPPANHPATNWENQLRSRSSLGFRRDLSRTDALPVVACSPSVRKCRPKGH
eukprot:GHVQ01024273.1.p1 GENE.GHVQ01024273.1~~GHVQ01024273.1.p1  ORF type:complete len:274 (-),score=15.07 GHVQ01024273.1:137-958(-)